MRTMLRGKVTLLFVMLGMLLAVPAVAFAADQLTDDLEGTATTQTITQGGTFTNHYWVFDNGGNGCEISSANPATFDVVTPAGVTADKSSLTFTACGNSTTNAQAVTFTGNTANASGYLITMNRANNTIPVNTGQASFTLIVKPPADATAPTLHLPANITEEATGASGKVVNFTATADDANPAHPTVACTPASGSTFAIGTTTVNCEATDAAGNKATGSFTVTVQDTTAPNISGTPSNITKEATGANGATASWTAPTASDSVDGTVSVACKSASGLQSGDTFPLGTTTVTCKATDAHGNTSTSTFDVKVQDTTAPSLTVPTNPVVVEATGASGATVNFANDVSATDAVDPSPSINCTPASGTTFALGTTQVSCKAKDAAGNESAAKTFDVKVQDTTAPSLNLPADITKTATSNSQVQVTYTATASDLVDGSVNVSCTPASGSLFSAGTTTVNCEATDAHTNKATGSFKVTVNYGWNGFFSPVDNPEVINSAKAGSTIPVKFSLGGNQGLDIFWTLTPNVSYPNSGKLTIDQVTGDPVDALEEYSTATVSGLKYDSTANQYIYNWKTDKNWAGTYRQLIIRLADGSYHRANFYLTK